MSLADLDPYYIKCLCSLHSTAHISSRQPSLTQVNLQELIRSKTGITKDFTPLITCVTGRHSEESRPAVHNLDVINIPSSPDNELELDLFNEDLMCVVCNGMDVAAGNRLLECSSCHSLYHQECHQPPVTAVDVEVTWICQGCLNTMATLKKTTPSCLSPTHIGTSTLTSSLTKQIAESPPHLQHSTSTTANYKSSLPSISKSSKSSKSTSLAKTSVIPNINIISADKRLQIMKKKAAKLHEKRKQMPR